MKKLLLLLVGVVVSLSLRADVIYLCGDNVAAGWTTTLGYNMNGKAPIEVSQDGDYFKFTAKGDFKLSTIKTPSHYGEEFNADGAFNSQALVVGANSNNRANWDSGTPIRKATMLHEWWGNNSTPAFGSDDVTYYRVKNDNGTYKIEAATSTSAFTAGQVTFQTNKSYYVDVKNHSGYLNNYPVMRIWDGTKNYTATRIGTSTVYTFKLDNAVTSITIKRCDPNNIDSTTPWNQIQNVAAPTGDNDMYVVGTNFTAGSWSTYTSGGGSITDPSGTYYRIWWSNSKDGNPDKTTLTTADGGKTWTAGPVDKGSSNFFLQKMNSDNSIAEWLGSVNSNTNIYDGVAASYAKDKDAFWCGSSGKWMITVDTEAGTILFEDTSEYVPTNFYFSGDMNVWSDHKTRNSDATATWTNGVFTTEKNGNDDGLNNGYFYMQDDVDNPWLQFRSKKEMEDLWKFEFRGEGPEGTTGKHWYCLDLAHNGATDLEGNAGRLCGQFKIITESLLENGNNYGVDGGANEAYWNKLIKVDETFSEGKQSGGTNFLLANTYVDNAELWFTPDNGGTVIVKGTPVDKYVYYYNSTLPAAGPKVYLYAGDQTNNFAHIAPFREWNEDYTQACNCVSSTNYDFRWEKKANVDYYPYGKAAGVKVTYPEVWAKKIPSSIAHRSPMGFLVSVKPAAAADGTWFPRERLACDDVWFIENSIDVYFRFADRSVNDEAGTQVFFNAWLDQYASDGSLIDEPRYLYNNMQTPMVVLEKDGKNSELWNALPTDKKYDAQGKPYKWFKAPVQISGGLANGGHAMFATNYGGFYPTNATHASTADRAAVALNGVDLYYVVGGNSSSVGILYDHLKGTVALTDNVDKIQVNAEFFSSGHAIYKDTYLNTFIGTEVDYEFTILDKDGNILQQSEGKDAENNPEDHFCDEPYFDWDTPEEAGLYTVKVRVRRWVGNKYEMHTATDIYPIFANRAGK